MSYNQSFNRLWSRKGDGGYLLEVFRLRNILHSILVGEVYFSQATFPNSDVKVLIQSKKLTSYEIFERKSRTTYIRKIKNWQFSPNRH